jgi:hypothetical protein
MCNKKRNKKRNRNKQKNKKINNKTDTDDTNDTDDTDDTEPKKDIEDIKPEQKKDIEELKDLKNEKPLTVEENQEPRKNIEPDDTDEEKKNYFEYKTDDLRPYIWINKTVYYTTAFIDKIEIYRLLNELYRTNTNYKKFLIEHNYLFIEVLKSFHLDQNKQMKSLHINIVFKQEKKGETSNVFHVYIDNNLNEITGITELKNIL